MLAGFVNNFSFKVWRVFSCQWNSSSPAGFEGGDEEGREVPIPVQSKMAFLAIRPAIRRGVCLVLKDSVRARVVASVPPR